MNFQKLFLLCLLFVLQTLNLFSQRNLPQSEIPNPDPMKQMESFILDEGLEINLFASDPMMAKPIGMNWDDQGRLWVVSSRLYPHIKPGQRSDDQVIVLEDKNGDGVADKSSVFAENLLIPTGIMPGDGGVYVANSTEILFMEDLDGDLKEDKRTVVLSGFGTEDTHHIIHSFKGAPDGMMYFNQSIYIHSHVETPHGVRRLMAGGIWHYRPETGKLEVFSRGFVNSWGHIFDRYGQSFATDGAYGEGINYVFPGSVFFTAYNAKRILRGLNPGQPKQCGLEIVNSSHFPDSWQGNLITNDFRGHRVNRFIISDSGSGFVSRQAKDLIRTNHKSFRPIDVKIGPDGALYIADWYNPIIQHGEVDFRDPRRDHVHGRIWRVTHKDRQLSKFPKLINAQTASVVEHLRSPDGVTRHFAKRQLRQRPRSEVVSELKKFVGRDDLDAEDKLEILWAHQAINHVNEDLLKGLLNSKDHRIRSAAVRVVYHWKDELNAPLSLVSEAINDDHPRVRLEAISTLRNIGTAQAFNLIMDAFDREIDSNIDFALWLAARELKSVWLPLLEEGKLKIKGRHKALQFILKASEEPEALKLLAGSLSSKDLKGTGFRELSSLYADLGDSKDIDLLYASAFVEGREKEDRNHVFNELIRVFKDRSIQPTQKREQELLKLVRSGNEAGAMLSGTWKIEGVKAILIKWLNDDEKSILAVTALGEIGDVSSLKTLIKIIDDNETNVETKAHAITAIARSNLLQSAAYASELMSEAKTPKPVKTILEFFLTRKDGPNFLADAISGKKMKANVAGEAVRMTIASGGETKKLIQELSKAGSLQTVQAGLSDSEMRGLMNLVKSEGSPQRGEDIYRRSQLLCQSCHAIAGAGGAIGPDLVSLGSSAPIDYIVDSMLEPAKKIKEGYHTTVVTTKQGEVITGGLVRDSDSELVLRMVDGSFKNIKTSVIEKKEISPVSLMPPGLTASLRKDEFIDLISFLSALGKEGEYKVPSGRQVRRWRVLPKDSRTSGLIKTKGIQFTLNGKNNLPWKPVYSYVDGGLPIAEMGINNGFNNRLSIAKFEIEVSVAGKIGIRLKNPKGLQLLTGGEMIEAKKNSSFTFSQGRQEIYVIVDTDVRESNLFIEIVDVDGSPGAAELVTGF